MTTDINPMENGVQQSYNEIRESLELILSPVIGDTHVVHGILISLDDAVSNNWDDLMASFWRGVAQDVELMEAN